MAPHSRCAMEPVYILYIENMEMDFKLKDGVVILAVIAMFLFRISSKYMANENFFPALSSTIMQ